MIHQPLSWSILWMHRCVPFSSPRLLCFFWTTNTNERVTNYQDIAIVWYTISLNDSPTLTISIDNTLASMETLDFVTGYHQAKRIKSYPCLCYIESSSYVDIPCVAFYVCGVCCILCVWRVSWCLASGWVIEHKPDLGLDKLYFCVHILLLSYFDIVLSSISITLFDCYK